MIHGNLKIRAVVLAAALAMVSSACGGGGGGGTTGGTPTGVTGTYLVNATVNDADCGGRTRVEQWIVQVLQSGTQATVEVDVKGDFTGTVTSNRVTVSGIFAEDDGYTSYTSFVFTVVGDALTGTILFTHSLDPTGAPVECQGTIGLSGSRGSASDVSGTYFVTAEINETACGGDIRLEDWTVSVFQSGSSITLRLPNGDIYGSVLGTQATVSGIYPDQGGYYDIGSLAFNVVEDVLAGSGSFTFSPNVTGTPVECQGTIALYGFRR